MAAWRESPVGRSKCAEEGGQAELELFCRIGERWQSCQDVQLDQAQGSTGEESDIDSSVPSKRKRRRKASMTAAVTATTETHTAQSRH